MRLRGLKVLFVVVAIAGAAAWFSNRPVGEAIGVTAELIGHWTTTDSRFEGRYLEISTEEIAFGQGEDREVRHRILEVRQLPSRDGSPRYPIRYLTNELDEAEVVIVLGGDGLRLANQPKVLWTRDAP